MGIAIACSRCSYQITLVRKIAAAGAFTVLNWLPVHIPVISELLPFVGMYVALINSPNNHAIVNKVFCLAVVFCIVALLIVYKLF